MAGIVKLKFTDCRFTGPEPISITVNGGTIVLEASPSLSMLSVGFAFLSIASGAISVEGPVGATINSQISFPVNATGNAPPTITATNFFSGQATIDWASNSETLSPGVPIPLVGFQN